MSVIYSVCRRVGAVVNCSQREASLSVVARKKKKKGKNSALSWRNWILHRTISYTHTHTHIHTGKGKDTGIGIRTRQDLFLYIHTHTHLHTGDQLCHTRRSQRRSVRSTWRAFHRPEPSNRLLIWTLLPTIRTLHMFSQRRWPKSRCCSRNTMRMVTWGCASSGSTI